MQLVPIQLRGKPRAGLGGRGGLEGASEAAGRLLQADEQVVGLHHVLTSAHVVLHRRRLGQRLAEEGLNVRLALSLVLTRLADGYDLVRQRIPRSAHQLALCKKEEKKKRRGKVKREEKKKANALI